MSIPINTKVKIYMASHELDIYTVGNDVDI
jgi:hypothetical protein